MSSKPHKSDKAKPQPKTAADAAHAIDQLPQKPSGTEMGPTGVMVEGRSASSVAAPDIAGTFYNRDSVDSKMATMEAIVGSKQDKLEFANFKSEIDSKISDEKHSILKWLLWVAGVAVVAVLALLWGTYQAVRTEVKDLRAELKGDIDKAVTATSTRIDKLEDRLDAFNEALLDIKVRLKSVEERPLKSAVDKDK